jgi:tetratricopeptide (TPR) repeat protein
MVLWVQGQLDEAIAAFRQAIKLDPKYILFYDRLGSLLLARGQFTEALAVFRRMQKLASGNPELVGPAARMVAEAEELVVFDSWLPAVLHGQIKPADNQLLNYAMCAYRRGFYGAAARFYRQAFSGQESVNPLLRYLAACAAARTGCGQGKDAGKLDARERKRWRTQALYWLRADLPFWVKHIKSDNPANQREARLMLVQWQRHADLACVRDHKALAGLPEVERRSWQRFWSEVAASLKRAPRGR